jgi:hypothetical protein
MLEIGTGICHLGVQLRDMPLVRTPRLRQLFRRSSTEPVIGQRRAGRKCGEGDPNPWKKLPVNPTPFLPTINGGVSRSKF